MLGSASKIAVVNSNWFKLVCLPVLACERNLEQNKLLLNFKPTVAGQKVKRLKASMGLYQKRKFKTHGWVVRALSLGSKGPEFDPSRRPSVVKIANQN